MQIPFKFFHANDVYWVHEYSQAQLDDIVALEQRANPFPWQREHFISSLKSSHLCLGLSLEAPSTKIRLTWIAHAVVSLVSGEAELLILAVEPAFQGKGIGKRLLQEIMLKLADKTQTLFLEVRASNTAAIKLYEALHFNQVGVRPNYYPASSGRPEDAYVFARELRNEPKGCKEG